MPYDGLRSMAKRETGWATGGKETVNGGAGEGNCNVEDV